MSEPIDGMLEALTLTDTGARTSEDIFTAPSQQMPGGRVFGGQVLAQSALAAMRTTDDDRIIHSMHAFFLRPGDTQLPITFAVDRVHDGRSFSTRRTQAYQKGLPILSMIASFQVADTGLDHYSTMPEGIPEPESLVSDAEIMSNPDLPSTRFWVMGRPFDIRHVEAPVYLSIEGERVAHQAVWLKTVAPLPDDPNLHRAALAYASDYTIIEPILRRHDAPWVTPGLKVASLDHAMWWHRFGRADEWWLYVQESPNASGGRGLSFGRIYSRDGVLLASVAQEGMVRAPVTGQSES